MRTFDELNEQEQSRAISKVCGEILEDILSGALRFNDELNQDDLQARIDAAISKAERLYTPWFAHEYIMDTCKEDLESMARSWALDALYPSPDETIIRL